MQLRTSVIFIDDDKIEHLKMQRVFKRMFPEVSLVKYDNPVEAISWLKQNKHSLPKLIILDLNMPKMTGFEVLSQLKSDYHLKKIAVVIFSTSSNQKDINQSFMNQVAGYFVKPNSSKEYSSLVDTISNYWSQSKTAK